MDELFKTIGKQAKWLLNVTNDVKDHTRELDALKAAHQKVASEQNSQEQRLTQLQREKEDLHARHMSLEERVDYLEKLLEKSAEKHTQEIERFKDKFLQMSGLMRDQVSGEQKTREGHASIEERLKYLESTIGDNAALTEKHEGFADRLDFIEKARDQERREFDAEVQALKHRLQQVQDSNGEACSEVAEDLIDQRAADNLAKLEEMLEHRCSELKVHSNDVFEDVSSTVANLGVKVDGVLNRVTNLAEEVEALRRQKACQNELGSLQILVDDLQAHQRELDGLQRLLDDRDERLKVIPKESNQLMNAQQTIEEATQTKLDNLQNLIEEHLQEKLEAFAARLEADQPIKLSGSCSTPSDRTKTSTVVNFEIAAECAPLYNGDATAVPCSPTPRCSPSAQMGMSPAPSVPSSCSSPLVFDSPPTTTPTSLQELQQVIAVFCTAAVDKTDMRRRLDRLEERVEELWCIEEFEWMEDIMDSEEEENILYANAQCASDMLDDRLAYFQGGDFEDAPFALPGHSLGCELMAEVCDSGELLSIRS